MKRSAALHALGASAHSFRGPVMIIDCDVGFLDNVPLLQQHNVDTVGRYYCTQNTYKLLGPKEAHQIAAAGLRLFVVYEDHGSVNLTYGQGKADATAALKQAALIEQPPDSAIYFAVEGLPNGYKAGDLPQLRQYFSGIKDAVAGKYAIGVYSDGTVCQAMAEEGFCRYTWLTAASYSFEGTKDFFASGRWSLAQLAPLDLHPDDWKGRKIDINCANGDFGSFLIPTAVA
jgi:hypothetical protein